IAAISPAVQSPRQIFLDSKAPSPGPPVRVRDSDRSASPFPKHFARASNPAAADTALLASTRRLGVLTPISLLRQDIYPPLPAYSRATPATLCRAQPSLSVPALASQERLLSSPKHPPAPCTRRPRPSPGSVQTPLRVPAYIQSLPPRH